MARAADKLSVEERIERITDIFSTFRNPDKETVLTPWRVVNMHLGDCLGGYNFFEKDYEATLSEPRFIDHGEVTANVFAEDARILEINSKSGLYPLYMAYSIYRTRVKNSLFSVSSIEDEQRIWDKVVTENIFVICKTPMAKSITKRTLIGFRNAKVNTRYFEDLINQIKNKPEHFIKQVEKFVSDRTGIKNMKFNAIVGNPPYQVMDGGGAGTSAVPVYNRFIGIAKKIQPQYLSMILPAKWYTGGKGLDDFRNEMLHDKHISYLADFADSRDCFPTVDIAGGICYFLWDKLHNGPCSFVNVDKKQRSSDIRHLDAQESFIRNSEAVAIIQKVKAERFFSSIVYSRNPFSITNADLTTSSVFNGSVSVFSSKGVFYVSPNTIKSNRELIGRWKVIVSKTAAEHAGQADKEGRKRVLSRITILAPNEVCSESYLLVSICQNKAEAQNVVSYLKTRFVRFLLSTILLTQNIAKDKFAYIPVLEFSDNTDIDWNRTISELDIQLYAKYHLTKEESAFIESVIKPM